MSTTAGPIYLDTSALLKLYLREPGSEELNRSVAERRDLLLSELAITEFVSAVARRKREGGLSPSDAGLVHRTLLESAGAGIYLRVELTPPTYRSAETILLSSEIENLRAADALHLALAHASDARTIATYDSRLRRAAEARGLALLPA
jgi:predicted nucleic acid-binding protein